MAIRSKGPQRDVPATYPKQGGYQPEASGDTRTPTPPTGGSGVPPLHRGHQPVNGPERPSNPPQASGVPSLINPERRQQLTQPQAASQSLDDLDVGQLLELREKIEQRLPAQMLADLNLEKELVLQYLAIKSMLAKIVDDEDTPANQRAQVANSVTSILGDMTKMQNSIYSSERVKKLEAAMIKAVEALPLEARQLFIERYEEIYNRL